MIARNVEMVRDVHNRHRDRLVDVREHVLEPVVRRPPERLVLFGADAQLGHRPHGAHGIFADGRLGREHHGVGAVHDGIRDIGHLGARRRRRVDHRLEHLRGRDAYLVAGTREPDQALLQARHRCVADFDRQVAARHHDDVARIDDPADVLDCLGTLDLRDDVAQSARSAQQRPRLLDILGVTRERYRHEVEAEPRSGLDVAAILGRQGRRRQPATLLVQALVIGELAALLHDGNGCACPRRCSTASTIRPSSSSSVSPGTTSFVRLRYAQPTACSSPAFGSIAVSSTNSCPSFSTMAPFLKDSTRIFGPLQVAHDADMTADLVGDVAHHRDARGLIGRRAVREVDPEHVGAGEDQLLDDRGVVGGRAERRDDLGAPSHFFGTGRGHERGFCRG